MLTSSEPREPFGPPKPKAAVELGRKYLRLPSSRGHKGRGVRQSRGYRSGGAVYARGCGAARTVKAGGWKEAGAARAVVSVEAEDLETLGP